MRSWQFTCLKLTVCLFYCMLVKSGTCLLLICTKLMSPGITVSEIFLMRVGERVQSRFYITAIPCLHLYWLIRERYCFIKETIRGSDVVLRTVCSLYFNEIQRLSSAYNILPWHTSYIDVRITFRSFFYFISVNLVCSLCLFLLCVSACAAFWRK